VARNSLANHAVALDDSRAPPRLATQEVGRPHDRRVAVEVGIDLAAVVGVVAERDHVGAGGEEPFGELGRDAGAVRDVLAVDDAHVRAKFLA